MTTPTTIHAVLEGASLLTAVEGGFILKPAPANGFAITNGNGILFVTAAAMSEAMVHLTELTDRAFGSNTREG